MIVLNSKRESILDTAMRCVSGERDQEYGEPERNFRIIAELWQTFIKARCIRQGNDVSINAEDVAAMMILFKIARVATGKGRSDNWVDIAGYAACGGEIEGGNENAE